MNRRRRPSRPSRSEIVLTWLAAFVVWMAYNACWFWWANR